MELIIAVALLVALVLYLRKAEPVAHAIVDNAAPGNGCGLLSALALGLPAIVILMVMTALADEVGAL